MDKVVLEEVHQEELEVEVDPPKEAEQPKEVHPKEIEADRPEELEEDPPEDVKR